MTRPSWAHTSVVYKTCMGRQESRIGSVPEPGRLAGGLLKPPADNPNVHFGRELKWLLYIDVGVRFMARTELGARKEDFGSGENRTLCVEDGYSLDDNICV